MSDLTADFVVVGGGSAGAAVAGRLSEDGRYSVVLLEAGPSDLDPWILMPIGYGKTFRDPTVNWMYTSEPEPHLDNRPIYVPRGKVLGGSSAVNAMVYSRGQPKDFEDWKALGNPGWGWSDVLAAYRRMEDHYLGEGALHGKGGPITVSRQDPEVHPLAHVFVKGVVEAGVPETADLNGESIEGAAFYQITTRGGIRLSTARAYLWPGRRRKTLSVITNAHATRLVLEGRKAVGVAYRWHGQERIVRARREVVLSAGAINTPQILQLSGVGPGEVLSAAGVPVAIEQPAVGRHLQDHLCYEHVYRARVPTLNDLFYPLTGRIRAGLHFLAGFRGPLSVSVNHAGGFFRTGPDVPVPDMQIYFQALSYEKTPPRPTRQITRTDPFSGFSVSISPCRPTSRGAVWIRSPDPFAPPAILANFLATPEDVETALAGARFMRRLSATPALSAAIAEELRPGPAVESDDALVADIRAKGSTVFHPVGSCRMGPDPREAVVDARLKAHGIEGLRIADASVFPTLTSGNTNAPAIMVGERAAAFILEDARQA